jgi:hypothetical protein
VAPAWFDSIPISARTAFERISIDTASATGIENTNCQVFFCARGTARRSDTLMGMQTC